MMAKPMTAIQLHYPMIQFLIIQEHFQPKIGRNIRKIQPGPEKQHSYIKKECMNLRDAHYIHSGRKKLLLAGLSLNSESNLIILVSNPQL